MDNGEVIPSLNEDWTFAGAKLMEWISGVAAAFVFGEIFLTNLTAQMPLFLGVLVGTPIALSQIRQAYPDEERGVRNHMMSAMGLCPPDIPKPSMMQPVWSGAPLKELDKEKDYMRLELDNLFNSEEPSEEKQAFA